MKDLKKLIPQTDRLYTAPDTSKSGAKRKCSECGEPALNRHYCVNGHLMRVHETSWRDNNDCPYCGEYGRHSESCNLAWDTPEDTRIAGFYRPRTKES